MNGLPRPADAALLALTLAPLAAGLALGADAARGLAGLGRAAGVLGLSCLLSAALVSVRVPGFDAPFGGLTRLWRLHHLLGAAAFALLMAHPLLLAFAAARTSLPASAAVLAPPLSAWSAWAGWAAFAALTAFLAPTFWFFGRPDYRRWKALHALSGAAVALSLVHAAASGRLLPGRGGLAAWGAFGGAALAAYLYRVAAAPLFARRGHVIVRREKIARGVVELTLAPEGPPLSYRAGQFIYLTPLSPALAAGRGEEHPFTLSSAPGEPALRVVVKDLGDASGALQEALVGSRALVEGPYGELFPREAGAPELWIAGGVGLTPFLSRARSFHEPVDADLIYCVQDESRAHFASELEGVAARVPGFRFHRHYFAREGPLTGAFIRARCPDFVRRDIFLCGPPPLIAAARSELRAAGAASFRVRSEEFSWL